MSRSRTSTYRRFEERHPDLWDEVQVIIESADSQAGERAEPPSFFARLFRRDGRIGATARRTRPARDERS
ncbi:MAG TPA: hypothetical protein VMH36_24410 [Alphaproteobacteria bacterium]|nr:hypothetical protein [Alphaproteobacteria bacterium]